MNLKISEKAVFYRINNQNLKVKKPTIGAYIRKERLAQGLKQVSVCKDICSVSYYSRIESNKVDPSDVYVNKILKKLNKPIPKNLSSINKEVINRFLTAIEYKNDRLVELEYQNIKNGFDIHIELYNFIYLIYHQKINEVKPLIKKLHSQQIHFNNEELLLYLENLASYQMCCKNYNDAEEILNLAIKLKDRFSFIRPMILYKYAWIQGKLHNDLKSIEYAEEAEKIFTINHNVYRSLQCQILIAIKMSRWFPDKGLKLYEKIYFIASQNNYTNMIKISKINLAFLYKKSNLIKKAENALLELINDYPNNDRILFNVYIEYIDLLINLSRFKEAYKYFLMLKSIVKNDEKHKFYIKYYDYKLNKKDIQDKLLTYKREFIPYCINNNKSLEIRVRREYASFLEQNHNNHECINEYKKIVALLNKKNQVKEDDCI